MSLVTLGVRDLPRARASYEALGWRGQEAEETVFFQAGGLALVLRGRDRLAADCGVPDPDGHPWEVAWNPGFTIAADGSITVPDLG